MRRKAMRTDPTTILGFVSQIVSSLAWPVTLLTCVLLLKRHLLALIPLVRTVKYSDVEIRFGQEVAELKKTADIANMAAGPKQDQWESLIRLADVKPRTAIRSAWGHIETSIRELAKKKNTDITDAAEMMPMVIGALLLNQGAITTDQYVLMQKLRVLLHEAERAEPDSITSASAAEYVTLALRLAASIIEKES
jgi:hypothetical protein